VEPRDYIDTAAALQRYDVGQLISFARRLDPGLEDGVFTCYGLTPEDVTRLREEFAAWPRS
jgi:hypothetical protein